ncbi:MAG: nitrous oxide reductase accessory protein NosL [Deltaproteobacteria bacterium]
MKKRVGSLILIILLFMMAGSAFADEDIKAHPTCVYCGMDRQQFAHSRMIIEYEDGTVVPFCSIHCAAVDLALKIEKTPKSIMVGDYATKELIDAEKAYWVLGGAKMGVMTKRAKWAFATKNRAERFISGNAGTLIRFDDALKASYADMNTDTVMIRNKKKMMRMKQMKSEGMLQHAH